MVSPRAVPALLATLVVLASTGAAAQIEPPRPVDELAPDSPAQRPSRTRREPPRPFVWPSPIAFGRTTANDDFTSCRLPAVNSL